MTEVFIVIFFGAWFHARKMISRISVSFSVLFGQFLIRTYSFFLYHLKNKIIEELLAVFLAATCFALPENKQEKGVICPIL